MATGTVTKVWSKPKPGFEIEISPGPPPVKEKYVCDKDDLAVVAAAFGSTVTVTDAPGGPPNQAGVARP